MKVLVLTLNAWNDSNSTGNTVSNLFSALTPSDEIANIYCRNEPVSNRSLCHRYFRITETDILHNILTPGKCGCISTTGSSTSDGRLLDGKARQAFFQSHRFTSFLLLREVIWALPVWKNAKLNSFLKDFAPDVIYMHGHCNIYMHRLLDYCVKKTGARVAMFWGDDMYGRKSKAPLGYFYETLLRQRFRKSIRHSTKLFGGSPMLCKEYSHIFGKTFVPFFKECKHIGESVDKIVGRPLTIVYAGNLLFGREEIMLQLANAIRNINAEGQSLINLKIFSSTQPSHVSMAALNSNGCAFMGCRPYEDVCREMDNADLALFIESFDKHSIRSTRLSFSTKIIDCMQSSAGILAIGPREIASMDYLITNHLAYVITDEEEIECRLRDLLADTDQIRVVNSNKKEFAEKYHVGTSPKALNELRELLLNRAIIIPGNTDLNRGDQALVWESARLVKDVYNDDVVCILMSDLDSKNAFMQNRQTRDLGFTMTDTVLKHPGRRFANKDSDSKSYSQKTLLQWGTQAIIDYLRTRLMLSSLHFLRNIGMLFLTERQKNSVEEIRQCDAIFCKGGGFLHSYGSITDPYFIYYLTYHIRLAEAFRKKVVVLPNSIGPLENRLARHIVKKSLHGCSLVTVRENISKNCLSENGVSAQLFPDLGFYLLPSERDMREYLSSKGVPLDQKKVAMTLRPYRFQGFDNSERLFNNYIAAIRYFVEYLVGENYHVSFIAHTMGPSSHEKDSIAIREVLNHLGETLREKVSLIEDYNLNCLEIEKIYSYYDYLIGTRFHSVIFALNVQVPAIAIAYGGNKGKGIMNVLGNDAYSIDMDKITGASLVEIFCRLEKDRDSYLVNLWKKRQTIDADRERLIDNIRYVLN